MQGRKELGTWLSAHIYFNGPIYGPRCDCIVREVVAPFVDRGRERKWIEKFFFIRYREYGPHIRLRFFGRTDVLEQEVKPALERHVAAVLPDDLRAVPNPSKSVDGGAYSPLHWTPYVPEFDRYGGKQGVQLAENFFHGSSRTAIAMLQQMDNAESRAERLGKGLMAMLVLIHTFYPEKETAAVFAGRHAQGYLMRLANVEGTKDAVLRTAFRESYAHNAETLVAYVDTAWERLHHAESISAILDPYLTCCLEIRGVFETLLEKHLLMRNGGLLNDWDRSVALILPSYVHMMNNRLGIPWHEEAYLGHVLSLSLAGDVEPILA